MRTIGDEMSLLIMECEKRTLEQVDSLIQMELAHANIRHIKFIKATASATTAFSKTLAKEACLLNLRSLIVCLIRIGRRRWKFG
jgi:hypothetical protein